MAASLSLTQLSSGNPVYDKYYRQVDPSGCGHVTATDAAVFLKKSGLTDLILGKIWDLADEERKGCLNKQQFFIALRLVACAQNGLEVTLKSLNAAVPPPKFHDSGSPLLPSGGVPVDCPWVVKAEEKLKFDAIFDSLGPVNGILSGEKVKPVLLNSKLPVDILGRVWDLSDIDRDGMLDRDEFAVAMHLVYRALEQEPVPMSLPAALIPPSKRKKPIKPPPVMPLLPSPPSHKDGRSSHSASKIPPSKPAAVTQSHPPQWVVSPTDKAKYDELFTKTDTDMDGLVSGPEVRDIFLKTGLPSTTLARIWELCDTGDTGKLTRDQFALALHLINQKLAKGVDPPQALTPEMIPPSDKLSTAACGCLCLSDPVSVWCVFAFSLMSHVLAASTTILSQAADFSAIKELDSLSNEIVDLQRQPPRPTQAHILVVQQPSRLSARQQLAGMVVEGEELSSEAPDGEEGGGWPALSSFSSAFKYSCLFCWSSREKSSVEQEIKEKEESIQQRSSEVQDLQDEVQRESSELQRLQSQRQDTQDALDKLDRQKAALEDQLGQIRQLCNDENELILSLQAQQVEQEEKIVEYQTELARAQEELQRLQEEAAHMEEKVKAAYAQLSPLQDSIKHSYSEVSQVQQKLRDLQMQERNVVAQLSWTKHIQEEPAMVNGALEEEQHNHQQEPLSREELQEQHEIEEQEQEERLRTPEEQGPRLSSPEGFCNVPVATWPEDDNETCNASSSTEVASDVKEEEESSKDSTPKVESPELEMTLEPSQLALQPLPQESTPPIAAPLDFFQADPFSDNPFGGDPFKGMDPFGAESFFKQRSTDPFTSDDPFSSGRSSLEPALFSSRMDATSSDPFSSTVNNPSGADPFSSKTSNVMDLDPFGSQVISAAPDPFTSSPPCHELPTVGLQ
ncbi:LOW QUALITY PROTEIN: epidermal growth factor receptor substrate 15 [Scleropages formosus]|uniref:LOW QUALITY PROTEIN: epidermal growth factor receptor substrate 15 n=1 Tax=Scleropages formosus TaxID=113540 RepID=UPI0010FAA2D5|nr:LOW QUALITY PROTEIN: epidermal growth factor receptor substrate 15 [Scleropages formosus]